MYKHCFDLEQINVSIKKTQRTNGKRTLLY